MNEPSSSTDTPPFCALFSALIAGSNDRGQFPIRIWNIGECEKSSVQRYLVDGLEQAKPANRVRRDNPRWLRGSLACCNYDRKASPTNFQISGPVTFPVDPTPRVLCYLLLGSRKLLFNVNARNIPWRCKQVLWCAISLTHGQINDNPRQTLFGSKNSPWQIKGFIASVLTLVSAELMGEVPKAL